MSQIESKCVQKILNRELIKKKKQEIDDENYKMRQFQVIRWEVLRQKKQEKLEEARERVRLRDIEREWTKIKRTRDIFAIIFQKFSHRRHEIYLKKA